MLVLVFELKKEIFCIFLLGNSNPFATFFNCLLHLPFRDLMPLGWRSLNWPMMAVLFYAVLLGTEECHRLLTNSWSGVIQLHDLVLIPVKRNNKTEQLIHFRTDRLRVAFVSN